MFVIIVLQNEDSACQPLAIAIGLGNINRKAVSKADATKHHATYELIAINTQGHESHAGLEQSRPS